MSESEEANTPVIEVLHHTQSPTLGKLAAALAAAQAKMENADKKAINPHFKSKYADLAAVREACTPIFEAGIAILQLPATKNDMVFVTTTFIHASGEWIACTAGAKPRAMDPQSFGSTVTYLRRYTLASMACLASEDDDGNAGSRQDRAEPPRTQPAQVQPLPATPWDALELNCQREGVSIAQINAWRKAEGKPLVTDMPTEQVAALTAWLFSPAAKARDALAAIKAIR